MNKDTIASRWAEWENKIRSRWAGISDADWARVSGDQQQIVALLQRQYGWTTAQAEAELDAFVREQGVYDRGPSVAPEENVRAQPGDVLGLDTGGETTGLGDTEEDEDARRIKALRAARTTGRD